MSSQLSVLKDGRLLDGHPRKDPRNGWTCRQEFHGAGPYLRFKRQASATVTSLARKVGSLQSHIPHLDGVVAETKNKMANESPDVVGWQAYLDLQHHFAQTLEADVRDAQRRINGQKAKTRRRMRRRPKLKVQMMKVKMIRWRAMRMKTMRIRMLSVSLQTFLDQS